MLLASSSSPSPPSPPRVNNSSNLNSGFLGGNCNGQISDGSDRHDRNVEAHNLLAVEVKGGNSSLISDDPPSLTTPLLDGDDLGGNA
mmetsp:Transcript_86598/g.167782  ORF Transcript_86598/g.167782 Transcript_86598/m.167782 type:complete len:87 (-) Transcript_86598:105-365(-)